jgi:hypothetical protein
MERRDFLLMRTTTTEKVAELRGQALYMRSLDATLTDRTDDDGVRHAIDRSADWLEETVADVKQRLASVDVVRLVDREFLGDSPLGRAVDDLLLDFVERGGRIERFPSRT